MTNLLIMLYLSMKFDEIDLSDFKVIAETCFGL